MSDVPNFLPEDDREYLGAKGLSHALGEEAPQGGGTVRRCVALSEFEFTGNLYVRNSDGSLERASRCEMLILIPQGYATTKLDSFYTYPRLVRPDGNEPDRATGREVLFGKERQFWSRHLNDGEWRAGIDGLETYINYVRAELAAA